MIEDSADKRVHSENTHDDDDNNRESNREDLEKRLAELTLDIRADTEEAEKKRRATTRLEAREFVQGITPPVSRAPNLIEVEKVVIAPGLDPNDEPTLVGCRNERLNRWEFVGDGDIVDAPDPTSTEPAPGIQEQTEANPVTPKTERRAARLVGLLVTGLLAVAIAIFVVVLRPDRDDTRSSHPATQSTEVPRAKVAVPPSATEGPEEKSPITGLDMANTPPASNDVDTPGLAVSGRPTSESTQSTQRRSSDRTVAGRAPLGGKKARF